MSSIGSKLFSRFSRNTFKILNRAVHNYCLDPSIGLKGEQLDIQKVARDFAKTEMYPKMASWDEQEKLPIDVLEKAGELGFGAIYCEDKFGGGGLSRLDASIIYEQLAAGCTSTAAYMSIHNMCAWMIDTYGSEPSENVTFPKWLLSRRSLHIVLLNLIQVEADTPGFHIGKKEKKLGWRSQPARIITFEECHVPVSNQIGADNQGFNIAMAGINGGRVNMASCSLGAAQMSFDLAIEHLKIRKQFGKSLSQFQWNQFKLADMATQLFTSRILVREAAQHLQEKTPHMVPLCAMAKLYATDNCFQVINQALQMFGGYGILKDYPMQQYLRDCRVHQIVEGTNEVMRMIIARDLLSNKTFY